MSPIASSSAGPIYMTGTLRYSRFGLATLFFWLLWGQFIYQLMETVIPGVLPLLLRERQASNTEISFIISSLNVVGNMVFNPVVSFWSDRHRGRWGRRRPFILYTTPLVVLFLALIPFGPEIADFFGQVPLIKGALSLSPIVPGILFIGVFVMGFQIFDVFVGAVYHYLVRDTVPEEFLGRFQGLFRLAGGLAPLLWNLAIFRHAETHMKEVFVGVALFYGVGMLLMCWKVKEGQFPPPEPLDENALISWPRRFLASVRLYLTDCFRDPIYWLCFLAIGFLTWSGLSGVYSVLFNREELGLPLAVQGNVNAINSALVLFIALPIGWLIDRWNYFRLTQCSGFLQGGICILGYFFIHDVPTLIAFGICYTIPKIALVMGVSRSIIAVYPKEKFGQFGSAGAAFASLGAIGMAILAAKFVDLFGNYRSFLLWQGLFLLATGLLFVVVERRWIKLGGRDGYKAP